MRDSTAGNSRREREAKVSLNHILLYVGQRKREREREWSTASPGEVVESKRLLVIK